jgi:hypothetical protein
MAPVYRRVGWGSSHGDDARQAHAGAALWKDNFNDAERKRALGGRAPVQIYRN